MPDGNRMAIDGGDTRVLTARPPVLSVVQESFETWIPAVAQVPVPPVAQVPFAASYRGQGTEAPDLHRIE